MGHIQRRNFGEYGYATVSFAPLAAVPVFFVVGEVYFTLVLLCLSLLEAEDVGFQCFYSRKEEPALVHRTYPIHIP